MSGRGSAGAQHQDEVAALDPLGAVQREPPTVLSTGAVIEASIFIASIVATVSPAETDALRLQRPRCRTARPSDQPGGVGLLLGGHVGGDGAVAHVHRPELAVDRAHHGPDAALVGAADRLHAEQQPLALLQVDPYSSPGSIP